MRLLFPGQEAPPEEGMANDSSILAWRMTWTDEPGELQSMESQRVRHDLSDLACSSSTAGPAAENPIVNAGDTGSIPGPGRFHTSQGN